MGSTLASKMLQMHWTIAKTIYFYVEKKKKNTPL